MDNESLIVNPEIHILHRKGVIFGGWLSGVREPMQLLEFDVALLSTFLVHRTPQEAAGELMDGDLRAWLGSVPTSQAVLKRIHQMKAAGLLIADEASPQRGQQPAQQPGEPKGPQAPTAMLRTGANIAIRPADDHWTTWSATRRETLRLDGPEAMLLMAFVTPAEASEVLARLPEARRNDGNERIGQLFSSGLLVRSEDRPMMSADPSRRRGAPVITAKRLGGPRWQDIEPDGRIPIYFTPHMENHYPLALGMIATAINVHDDGRLLKRFQPLPICYLTPQQLFEGISRKFGTGVWLFSNYLWSLDINLKIANLLKSRDPGILTVFGGPSVPGYPAACTEFMNTNRAVDIAVHGEGEVAITELLEQVERGADGSVRFSPDLLGEVPGLTFRSQPGGCELTTTAPRTRLKEPDSIPSPYLTGVFDSYDGAVEAAIIESDRGCPFGCTFCDWGSATRQKVRKFDLDRVKQEIEWIGRNEVRVIWIANANFGMYDRDIDLAEYIVETKRKYGFPQEVVVNYTKNTTRRLVDIIKAFSAGGIISQGIISIQTTDEATLEVINRRNIKTEKYDELTEVFAEAELPLSTDLMIGLPGITPEAFDRDLQRYFDVDVSTKAYPTQLLPNSPMADPEYLEKYRIRTDENDFIISCHSFDEQELADMKAIFNVFMIADGYSVLRYVLRFLQWDHGIAALEFLHTIRRVVRDAPDRYPRLTWVVKYFVADKFMPGGWKLFYDEVAELAREAHGIERDTAFDTALLVNELAMPDETRDYPVTIELPHDLVAWFRHHNARKVREPQPLFSFPPGSFTVDDPDSMVSIDMDYLQYDSHQYFWELRSATARAKSVSDAKLLREAAQR
ncbi:MAG: radical SAM protein [Xanthomonadales bacterium]|nr:radical SAM protein [Xanthomonadales bacterium]